MFLFLLSKSIFLFSVVYIDNMEKVITTETLVKDYDFETGNKIINDYIILREIGRGVHGKVKLAKNKYNGQLVVKLTYT